MNSNIQLLAPNHSLEKKVNDYMRPFHTATCQEHLIGALQQLPKSPTFPREESTIREQVALRLLQEVIVMGAQEQEALDECLVACGPLEALSACATTLQEIAASVNGKSKKKKKKAIAAAQSSVESPSILETVLRTIRRWLVKGVSFPPDYDAADQYEERCWVEQVTLTLSNHVSQYSNYNYNYHYNHNVRHGNANSHSNNQQNDNSNVNAPLIQACLESLTKLVLLFPVQISNACHALGVELPTWAIASRYNPRLIEGALSMALYQQEIEGSSYSASYFKLLVQHMVRSRNPDDVALGLYKYHERHYRSRHHDASSQQQQQKQQPKALCHLLLQLHRHTLSPRESAYLLRSIMISSIPRQSHATKIATAQLTEMWQRHLYPYMELSCRPILLASRRVREAFVRLLILSPSSVLNEEWPDRLLCHCVASLLANPEPLISKKTSIDKTRSTADSESSSSDSEDSSSSSSGSVEDTTTNHNNKQQDNEAVQHHAWLAKHVQEVIATWSLAVFVRQTDHRLQRHVTNFLLSGMCFLQLQNDDGNFSTGAGVVAAAASRHDRSPELVSGLLEGVTVRLESSIATIRKDGMLIAERLAQKMGQELQFDELDQQRSLGEDDEVTFLQSVMTASEFPSHYYTGLNATVNDASKKEEPKPPSRLLQQRKEQQVAQQEQQQKELEHKAKKKSAKRKDKEERRKRRKAKRDGKSDTRILDAVYGQIESNTQQRKHGSGKRGGRRTARDSYEDSYIEYPDTVEGATAGDQQHNPRTKSRPVQTFFQLPTLQQGDNRPHHQKPPPAPSSLKPAPKEAKQRYGVRGNSQQGSPKYDSYDNSTAPNGSQEAISVNAQAGPRLMEPAQMEEGAVQAFYQDQDQPHLPLQIDSHHPPGQIGNQYGAQGTMTAAQQQHQLNYSQAMEQQPYGRYQQVQQPLMGPPQHHGQYNHFEYQQSQPQVYQQNQGQAPSNGGAQYPTSSFPGQADVSQYGNAHYAESKRSAPSHYSRQEANYSMAEGPITGHQQSYQSCSVPHQQQTGSALSQHFAGDSAQHVTWDENDYVIPEPQDVQQEMYWQNQMKNKRRQRHYKQQQAVEEQLKKQHLHQQKHKEKEQELRKQATMKITAQADTLKQAERETEQRSSRRRGKKGGRTATPVESRRNRAKGEERNDGDDCVAACWTNEEVEMVMENNPPKHSAMSPLPLALSPHPSSPRRSPGKSSPRRTEKAPPGPPSSSSSEKGNDVPSLIFAMVEDEEDDDERETHGSGDKAANAGNGKWDVEKRQAKETIEDDSMFVMEQRRTNDQLLYGKPPLSPKARQKPQQNRKEPSMTSSGTTSNQKDSFTGARSRTHPSVDPAEIDARILAAAYEQESRQSSAMSLSYQSTTTSSVFSLTLPDDLARPESSQQATRSPRQAYSRAYEHIKKKHQNRRGRDDDPQQPSSIIGDGRTPRAPHKKVLIVDPDAAYVSSSEDPEEDDDFDDDYEDDYYDGDDDEEHSDDYYDDYTEDGSYTATGSRTDDYDDDDSVWDESDNRHLDAYDVDDDEEDLVDKPLYLRDCLEMLRAPESDRSAYSKHEAVLKWLPRMIQAEDKPADLPDLAVPLALELMRMENKFNLDNFEDDRLISVIALAVAEPLAVGQRLILLLWEDIAFMDRLDVLTILSEAAFDLSGNKGLEEWNKTSKNRRINSDSSTYGKRAYVKENYSLLSNKDTSTMTGTDMGSIVSVHAERALGQVESKTRRWGRGRRQPDTHLFKNRFGPIAHVWYYSLVGGFLQRKDNTSLWGGAVGARLLANLFVTLATIVECGGVSPGTDVLAKDLFELVWSFRTVDVAEVRMSVLVAVAASLSCLSEEEVLTMMFDGSLSSLPEGLKQMSQLDPDSGCRRLANSMSKGVSGIVDSLQPVGKISKLSLAI